jgi:hypothetical protein
LYGGWSKEKQDHEAGGDDDDGSDNDKGHSVELVGGSAGKAAAGDY